MRWGEGGGKAGKRESWEAGMLGGLKANVAAIIINGEVGQWKRNDGKI